MESGEFVKQCKRNFGDNIYKLKIFAKNSVLHIKVEHEPTGEQWNNQFSSSCIVFCCVFGDISFLLTCISTFKKTDIEEMTNKAGNFKTFETFAEMLCSALDSTKKSVCIDMLTYHDLETLKTQKRYRNVFNGNQRGRSLISTTPQSTNNKRYLILTYISDFDRHFFCRYWNYFDLFLFLSSSNN
ncbi:hypothetical protein RFI_11385 [Reticulomyxa filosa]|uniref:Uncharacterized protein n=1 Tax=Reticulomyxa filosa TaxID=46433 RepID=X6NK65_RETFI|nr:hypothetical protein RFI_11385 [Reticulomyxa filosa]|eukprot:ETO25752.1 hypothetical protein RFI_11385 [Reticulomyxa filosa]